MFVNEAEAPTDGEVQSHVTRWPGGLSFSEYATELHDSRAKVLEPFLPRIEVLILDDLPEVLLEFPTLSDRELAIQDFEDQSSLQALSDEARKAVREVVQPGLVKHAAALSGERPSNIAKFDRMYEAETLNAKKLAHRIEAWRNSMVRKHGKLQERVESIESQLDEVVRFRVGMVREQAGALRTATGGTVKLLFTISAAISASLATLLSTSGGLGALFAIGVGSTLVLGLLSVGCGVGYVLHHRSVLKTELSGAGTDAADLHDPDAVAQAMAASERKPFPWVVVQGILLVIQLVAFAFVMSIYLISRVVPSPEVGMVTAVWGMGATAFGR